MRVLVESPFSGGHDKVKYARECLRDCLDRGESPYASHLLYTQKGVLDDAIPEERMRGIHAANSWLEVVDVVAIYMDMGVTPGMVWGIAKAAALGKTFKLRWIKINRAEETINGYGPVTLRGTPISEQTPSAGVGPDGLDNDRVSGE